MSYEFVQKIARSQRLYMKRESVSGTEIMDSYVRMIKVKLSQSKQYNCNIEFWAKRKF